MSGTNILFANNASSTLASGIGSGTTAVTLATGTGALFPSPSGGQYFCLTFQDASTGLVREITHCTARSGDVLTIVRAQEGTSAHSWLAGDVAANFLTAGSIAALQAGFPISTLAVNVGTTFSSANSGAFVSVSGSSTVQVIPDATTVSGMPIGFLAITACTITITAMGGVFKGGALTGTTSVALAIGDFVCIQSDGTNWSVFSVSPDLFLGGTVATRAWVTANFDPLGAAAAAQVYAAAVAATAQSNAETYAAGVAATAQSNAETYAAGLVSTEASTRAAADTTLQSNINTTDTNLANAIAAYNADFAQMTSYGGVFNTIIVEYNSGSFSPTAGSTYSGATVGGFSGTWLCTGVIALQAPFVAATFIRQV